MRPYIDSDRDDVIALWNDVFPSNPAWNDPEMDIQRKLAVQRELLIVATEDDRLVGTVMAGYDGHRGWVYYLAVKEEYRRKGIARAMMSRVEKNLETMGCPKLNLQVRSDNQEVIEFYKSLGYHVEERVSMGKKLKSTESDSQ